MEGLAFFGLASNSIYTHGGNGHAYPMHGEEHPGWHVTLEICSKPIARFNAVANDFGDLVPVGEVEVCQ